MNFTNKKIGIWGLGTVGTVAIRYFAQHTPYLQVTDRNKPTQKIHSLLSTYGAHFIPESNILNFLNSNDYILASPGIDLRLFSHFKYKWITELDLIQAVFDKPVIAITGTVGKTTITHLLSQILNNNNIKIFTGGNIGRCMIELLLTNQAYDCALLEVSSFQLEQCKSFAPDLAIWTNFYPNHLDRHGTIEQYFNAKQRILINQTDNQYSLLPIHVKAKLNDNYNYQSIINTFPTQTDTTQCTQQAITFPQNWHIIEQAVPLIMGLLRRTISITQINTTNKLLTVPEHRLEKIITKNGVDFYNDSKSTTPASTIAAVKQLSSKPIHLLLGGLSKGIDREPMIKEIKKHITAIYTFGSEAKNLKRLCQKNNVPCWAFKKLSPAYAAALSTASTSEIILFSPSGSSFDLYQNYKERGEHFKQLVL